MTEILVLIILPVVYFVPTFIAYNRRAAGKTGILILNILTGWTGLGWMASLIWACAAKKEFDPMLLYNISDTTIGGVQDFDKKLDGVQKLKNLLDSGAITTEEFESQKSKLLS